MKVVNRIKSLLNVYTLLFIVLALGLIGWVMNIITLFGVDEITGMVVARGIGIVVPPLGAVLGWF